MSEKPLPERVAVTLNACWSFALLLIVPMIGGVLLCGGLDLEVMGERALCMVLAQALGLAAICAFAYFRRTGLNVGRGRYVPLALGGYVAFMLLWVPFAFILYPWLVHQTGHRLVAQDTMKFLVELDSDTTRVLLVIVACGLAPLAEEILFRGYLFRAFESRGGPWIALAISSVLFGLMHGVLYAVPLTFMGAFFAWLRYRTGGLAAPILAHMLHNSLTVSVTLVWPRFMELVFDPSNL